MSEFWKRKMKTYFMKHDVDSDGLITDKDFEILALTFAQTLNADEERKAKIVKGFRDLWQKWIMAATGDGKQNLTLAIFIESIRSQLHDPEEYKKTVAELIRNLFDVMDIKDGNLEEDHYHGLFEALGMHTAFARKAFHTVAQDGKLSIDDFIEGYFEFMFTDDEKNPYSLLFGPLEHM